MRRVKRGDTAAMIAAVGRGEDFVLVDADGVERIRVTRPHGAEDLSADEVAEAHARGKREGVEEERKRIFAEVRRLANNLCMMRSLESKTAGATLFSCLLILERCEHLTPREAK